MPARLYHERIAGDGSSPQRSLLVTHGIYGAGSNWRAIARKVHERRSDWAVVLVDLRQHGRSEPGEPPHTLDACAGDVAALVEELGDVAAIAGHSFGGKVVLAARAHVRPRQTWVLDASPSARPEKLEDPDNTVVRVLELMERLPKRWARRDDFAAAVIAAGYDAGLAHWLATNLVPDNGALVLRLDLVAMRELLADYYVRDLWPALFAVDGDVELVLADRATTVDAADRTRLASAPPHVHVHHVDAGHWLHIDAPAAVVDLLAARLP